MQAIPTAECVGFANAALPLDIFRHIISLRKGHPVEIFLLRCVSRSLRALVAKQFPQLKKQCKGKLLEYATLVDSLPLLIWMHEKQRIPLSKNLMSWAASVGSLSILTWLHEKQNFSLYAHLVELAAMGGNLDILQWLLAHGYHPQKSSFKLAARGNHIHVLRWMERYVEIGSEQVNVALETGDSDTAHLLLDSRLDLWNRIDLSYACASGNVALVEWLHRGGVEITESCVSRARARRQRAVLEWLLTKSPELDRSVLNF